MAFEVRWEIDDGYVGKSRPQKFKMYFVDIEHCETEEELKEEIYQWVYNDFENKISPFIKNLDQIIEYWKEHKQEV